MRLKQEIRTGLTTRTFSRRLAAYCLKWREHRSRYALANAVRHLVDLDMANELFDTLADLEFRDLKRSTFGVNALRDDVQLALDYFSHRHLDVLRYIQVLFLEQSNMIGMPSINAHARHRRAFEDFVQMDVPAADRKPIGIHRVLHRLFPMELQESTSGRIEKRVARIELLNYEIGQWRCKCGALRGHAHRYDYACPCGQFMGNGQVTYGLVHCVNCRNEAQYTLCGKCQTRVTLDLFWHMREGGVHPSACWVPVTAELNIRRKGQAEFKQRVDLIRLPLMLGLREKGDTIVFEPPDIFWIHGRDPGLPHWAAVQLLGLPDVVKYDRQNELGKALASALRRTLQERGKGRSLRAKLTRLFLREGAPTQQEDFASAFGVAFEHRLEQGIAAESDAQDLIGQVDLTRDCMVGSSPILRQDMAWVNRRMLRPGAFVAPCLMHLTKFLRKTAIGPDQLTPTPMDRDRAPTMAEDGIVIPASQVFPGDRLVGVVSRRSVDELTPTEKLIYAIFDKVADRHDTSLTFEGAATGRVLSVHVMLPNNSSLNILPGTGKFVVREEWMKPSVIAQIGVTIAAEQTLEAGDVLYGEGASAVVCHIATGESLMRTLGLEIEPDIVVAPDHPWIAGNQTPGVRMIRVGPVASRMLGQEVAHRSSGPYSLMTMRPLDVKVAPGRAQRLTSKDFHWLVDRGAGSVAMELFGPRCDCVDWRTELFEALVQAGRKLADLKQFPRSQWHCLLDSPSEGVRQLEMTLRAAALTSSIEGNTLSIRPVRSEDLLQWSFGEVKKAEILDLKTNRAVPGGLMCPRIFGAEKDWQCACGKLKGSSYKEVICPRCGVQVNDSNVRRQRMGHIKLPTPMVHPWFYRGTKSPLAEAIGLGEEDIDELVHEEKYLVTASGSSSFPPGALLDSAQYYHATDQASGLEAVTGAEAIEQLLHQCADRRKARLAESCILHALPVLPVDLRPAVVSTNGPIITADLNILYWKVLV